MTQKIIFPEDMTGEENQAYQRLMALVPDKDQADIKLRRFLAFRMRIDGEEAARAYLIKGIEHARVSVFDGTLYEYLVAQEATLPGDVTDNTPPDEPG
jgi:hypothetical protein